MSNVTSGYDKQEGHHYISDKNLIPKYTYHYFKEGNSNEKRQDKDEYDCCMIIGLLFNSSPVASSFHGVWEFQELYQAISWNGWEP